MAKAEKKTAKSETKHPANYKEKVAIKGSFLDVFKVVKKDAERRTKEGRTNLEKKVDEINSKKKDR